VSQTTYSERSIESWLWDAANILRGPVDASDFKAYIFPLLFLKRISDVYDEERASALAESDGDAEYADQPEQHRFLIPSGCHWSDLQSRSTNVGQAIQRAMREVEQANPNTLYGIFGDVQWTNKERLPDSLLVNLIDHFSKMNLSNSDVPYDVLGDAYEYLIKKFADLTNKKAGEFYTPRSVVNLMVRILDPQPGETVYDPACGTGGLLLETLQHVRENGGDDRLMLGRLFGQEKNLTTAAIARMNLFLHGAEDFNIVRGDTLRQPAFMAGDQLATFDCVIANPPFSLKAWGEDAWLHDPWRRNFAGTPPKSYADWAWLQHMVTSMAPKSGRLAVVVPSGSLFRMGTEGKIRQSFIEKDLIESVIQLGNNLFYGTTIPACIVICRNQKPSETRENVLFVNASEMLTAGRNQNFLEPSHVEEIDRLIREFQDVSGIARVVPLTEIIERKGNMNVSEYVFAKHEFQVSSLAESVEILNDAVNKILLTEERLLAVLAKFDTK
jgi:type I restriction enzyme M protein